MSLIPKKIFQSWKTHKLSSEMKAATDTIIKNNPNYKYELSDDSECRNFILKSFGRVYADAFDDLIPGAFKSDFWRYGKLYVEGGVYMDIDFTALPGVTLDSIIGANDTFISVVDIKNISYRPPCGIYQAFIACAPKHPLMLKAFELTYYNIINHSNNTGILDITGPVMLGKILNTYWDRYSMLSIHSGVYTDNKFGGNIRLLEFKGDYILDLNDRKLFNVKFDGYKDDPNNSNYGNMERFFRTLGREWNRNIETYINKSVENYRDFRNRNKCRFPSLQIIAVILIFISIIIMYYDYKNKNEIYS